MEKGFRLVRCPNCPGKIKISITEKQYGHTLLVTYPKCGAKCRVKIPHPAPDNKKSARANSSNSFDLGGLETLFGDLFKKPSN